MSREIEYGSVTFGGTESWPNLMPTGKGDLFSANPNTQTLTMH